jgi:transcription elongation factor GreA
MLTQLRPTSGHSAVQVGRLPISAKAHQELLIEIELTEAALTKELVRRGRELLDAAEESGSPAEAELLLLASRLETLNRAAAASTIVNQNGRIVVGSRVTVRRPNAINDATYELVPPGMSDVRLGRISADSALGATLIGRKANEEALFLAPAGEQRLTIIDVS